MHSIRLIAVDIDGTLLNSSFQVSAGNLQALLGAHERGVEIALVTGRRHHFALPAYPSSVPMARSPGRATAISFTVTCFRRI
jgi:hydroxymethylpyrimidine pyrophosphatase-like HAD family hydrolase